MHNLRNFFILLIIITAGCREKYIPPVNQPLIGYLVVDGFINSGVGPTTIVLSRTTKLSGINIQYESKALVSVEGKLNTTGMILAETSKDGTYAAQLNLNPSDQYRLRILTQGGREYLSDYSSVRRTPDIDSIAWRQEPDGVRIYGNTHDTKEPTGYYQWKFDETWEIHSTYTTRLKAYNDVLGIPHHVGYRDSANRGDDLSMYFCWRDEVLRNILISTTQNLTKNYVSMFPLRTILNNSEELGVRYSMNAKLYVISKENFKFLEMLKKNTEQLGTIFDAQPSENQSNIRSVSNPSETVIGFVEVSEEKSKRIFIDQQQINWRYRQGCESERRIANTPPLNISATFTPTQVYKFNAMNSSLIDSVFIAETVCVDCTTRGYNKKPSFW